ncbi:MAG: histidine kinase, partial [Streptomycetaceae bacterium]|nr:histidine kinase [Streptomycetaceae bacterium]
MATGPEGMMPPSPPWSTEPAPEFGLWWLATAVAVPALALRRRWPLPLLGVCALTAVAHMSIGALGTPIDLATPILLGTVAVRHSRRLSVGVLVVFVIGATLWSAGLTDVVAPGGLEQAIAGQTTVVGKRPPEPPVPPAADVTMVHYSEPEGLLPATWGGLPVLGSVLIAAWAFGSRAKARRAWLDELTARARDLERERDQRAALAVAAERDRISRELHDVVAHGLSVMVVQAQGGAAAMDNRPADTRAALA